jgi:hypothetical protein
MVRLAVVLFCAVVPPSEGQAPPVAGEWDASYNTPGGPRNFKIVFQVKGDSLTGTVKRSDGEIPLTGKITGDQVTFSYVIAYNNEALTLTVIARLAGDTMSGTVDFAGMAQEAFSARRAKAP